MFESDNNPSVHDYIGELRFQDRLAVPEGQRSGGPPNGSIYSYQPIVASTVNQIAITADSVAYRVEAASFNLATSVDNSSERVSASVEEIIESVNEVREDAHIITQRSTAVIDNVGVEVHNATLMAKQTINDTLDRGLGFVKGILTFSCLSALAYLAYSIVYKFRNDKKKLESVRSISVNVLDRIGALVIPYTMGKYGPQAASKIWFNYLKNFSMIVTMLSGIGWIFQDISGLVEWVTKKFHDPIYEVVNRHQQLFIRSGVMSPEPVVNDDGSDEDLYAGLSELLEEESKTGLSSWTDNIATIVDNYVGAPRPGLGYTTWGDRIRSITKVNLFAAVMLIGILVSLLLFLVDHYLSNDEKKLEGRITKTLAPDVSNSYKIHSVDEYGEDRDEYDGRTKRQRKFDDSVAYDDKMTTDEFKMVGKPSFNKDEMSQSVLDKKLGNYFNKYVTETSKLASDNFFEWFALNYEMQTLPNFFVNYITTSKVPTDSEMEHLDDELARFYANNHDGRRLEAYKPRNIAGNTREEYQMSTLHDLRKTIDLQQKQIGDLKRQLNPPKILNNKSQEQDKMKKFKNKDNVPVKLKQQESVNPSNLQLDPSLTTERLVNVRVKDSNGKVTRLCNGFVAANKIFFFEHALDRFPAETHKVKFDNPLVQFNSDWLDYTELQRVNIVSKKRDDNLLSWEPKDFPSTKLKNFSRGNQSGIKAGDQVC